MASFPSLFIFWDVGWPAIPIGGTTLHSAAGIGVPQRPRDFNRMWHLPVRRKWRNLEVLIVDEISMVSAELLEYLEQTITRVRTLNKDDLPVRPFGGLQVRTSLDIYSWYTSLQRLFVVCDSSNIFLQVIFAGDFFQLQPVEDKDYYTCSDRFLNRGLACEAPAWDRAKLKTVILSRVFRQVCPAPENRDAHCLFGLVLGFRKQKALFRVFLEEDCRTKFP